MLPDLNDTALLWLAPMRKFSFIIYYPLSDYFFPGFVSLFLFCIYFCTRTRYYPAIE